MPGLTFQGMKECLKKDGVTLPPELDRFVTATELSCDLFYCSENGPLLIVFPLTSTDGVIESLTHSERLGELFTAGGGSVRIFRCSKDDLPALRAYVARLLSGGSTAPCETDHA